MVEWSGCERRQVGGRSHMVLTTSAGDSAVKALAEGVVKLAIVATILWTRFQYTDLSLSPMLHVTNMPA